MTGQNQVLKSNIQSFKLSVLKPLSYLSFKKWDVQTDCAKSDNEQFGVKNFHKMLCK